MVDGCKEESTMRNFLDHFTAGHDVDEWVPVDASSTPSDQLGHAVCRPSSKDRRPAEGHETSGQQCESVSLLGHQIDVCVDTVPHWPCLTTSPPLALCSPMSPSLSATSPCSPSHQLPAAPTLSPCPLCSLPSIDALKGCHPPRRPGLPVSALISPAR